MTEAEREELIKSILPDVVAGKSRPTEGIPTDMPYSEDFPQLMAQDPASYEVFNLILRQIFSNFAELKKMIPFENDEIGNIVAKEEEDET